MKDELGGKILNEFVGPRAKTYSYLRNDNNESRKAKDWKDVSYKELKFKDYKTCL